MDAVIRAVEKKGVKAHLMNDAEEVEATGAIGYLLWWPRHYASLRIEGGNIWSVDSLKGGLPAHAADEGEKASVIREVSGGKDGRIVKFLRRATGYVTRKVIRREEKSMERAASVGAKTNHSKVPRKAIMGMCPVDWAVGTALLSP